MDYEDTRDLIGHLFALITAKLEDAAALAVEGQVASPEQVQVLATQIGQNVEEARILLKAVSAL
jgi:hypothetical protein